MRITSAGNVGIGTTLPDSPLEIQNVPALGENKMMLHLDANHTGNTGSAFLQISAGGSSGAHTKIEMVSGGGQGLFGTYVDANIINNATSSGAYGNINFITGSSTSASSIVMTIGGGSQKGNVGIGTTSPSYKLHVAGEAGIELFNSSGGGDVLNFRPSLGDAQKYNMSISSYDHSGSGTGAADGLSINGKDGVSIATGTDTTRTERMRITIDGALLVGGTSPPSTSWKGTAVFGQQGTNKVIIGYLSAFSENVVGGHNSALDAWDSLTLAGTDFKFRTGSGATNTSMVIDSSGNVGIGATSIYPQGSNTILKLYSTSIPRFYLQNTTTGSNTTDGSQIYVSGSDLYITNSESANTIFSTNSLERMRVNSQGNFLVGATALSDVGSLTKSHLLEGISETAGTGAVGVYNNSGTANCPSLVVLNRDTSTDSSNRFIQFYANVIGGTNTPMGGIVGNGASNVQFASLSDIREKENVKTINGSLDKISKLNPVEFDWKKSGEHINAGFIAQEVENIFPEYVVENISNEEEEERKGLTGGMTSGIVAHLVKAIQELEAKIKILENK